MAFIGIDIGSTYAKLAVLEQDGALALTLAIPTGWSSPKAAGEIKELLAQQGYPIDGGTVVATGYGRISVPYAHKTVTEITCHAKGAAHIFGQQHCTVIDIGGQDTKVISIAGGMVQDFIMNDKCSAGTGRFLEVMAGILGVNVFGLCDLASRGGGVSISSMCTVFAESEVVSLMAAGETKENIAYALVSSVSEKVKSLSARALSKNTPVYLTGGLCECPYLLRNISEKIGVAVTSAPLARYAGAVGAAVLASTLQ